MFLKSNLCAIITDVINLLLYTSAGIFLLHYENIGLNVHKAKNMEAQNWAAMVKHICHICSNKRYGSPNQFLDFF